MKRVYAKPMMMAQMFMPNEYVAACGEENKVYKFVCNANSGAWFTNGGLVYVESNGEDGLQIGFGGDTLRSTYYPCADTHEAKTTDEFKKGYLWSLTGGTKEVIIWTGRNDDNTHCTTNLDIDSWQTAKS